MLDLFNEQPTEPVKVIRKVIKTTSVTDLSNGGSKIQQLEKYIETEVIAGRQVPDFIYEQLKKYKGEVENVQYVKAEQPRIVKQGIVHKAKKYEGSMEEYRTYKTISQWKVVWKETFPEWMYKDLVVSYRDENSNNRAENLTKSLVTGLILGRSKLGWEFWHRVMDYIKNDGDLKSSVMLKPSTAFLFLYNLSDEL